MRPSRPLARPVAALASILLVAAACSDAASPRSDALTEREAAWLALALGERVGAVMGDDAGAPALASSLDPSPFRLSVDTDVPCPLGGSARTTVTIEGTVDPAAESITADLEGSLRPAGCVLRAETGLTFTVTGTPGLASEAHVVVAHGQPVGEQRAALTGAFSWSASDGRSGSCTVDYRATANYATNQATVQGNVCGTTVEFSGPIE